jgi:hypothetical protein
MGVISPDPKAYFGAGYHRLWDKDQFLDNQAKVIVFLCANTSDPKTPIIGAYDTAKTKSGYPATLQAMYTSLAQNTRVPVFDASGKPAPKPPYNAYAWYLDIEDRKLITRDEAIALVSGSLNIDNGQLGGLDPPSILGFGGMPTTGKWNDESEDDAFSKASTAKVPLPPPPKPEPPPPEPKPTGMVEVYLRSDPDKLWKGKPVDAESKGFINYWDKGKIVRDGDGNLYFEDV